MDIAMLSAYGEPQQTLAVHNSPDMRPPKLRDTSNYRQGGPLEVLHDDYSLLTYQRLETLIILTDTGIEQIFMDNTSGYTGLAKIKDTSNEPRLSLVTRPTPPGCMNIDHHLEKL